MSDVVAAGASQAPSKCSWQLVETSPHCR